MRRAEALESGRTERLEFSRLGHVEAEGEHRRAECADLGRGLVERILLHVGHHDVHAQTGGDARGFEAEARARAGDDGRAALEVLHGMISFKR